MNYSYNIKEEKTPSTPEFWVGTNQIELKIKHLVSDCFCRQKEWGSLFWDLEFVFVVQLKDSDSFVLNAVGCQPYGI